MKFELLSLLIRNNSYRTSQLSLGWEHLAMEFVNPRWAFAKGSCFHESGFVADEQMLPLLKLGAYEVGDFF